MRQRDRNRMELTWFSVDLKEGLATGNAIQETRTSTTWVTKQTGVGGIVRIRQPGKSGVVILLIDIESNVHQKLRELALIDESLQNVVGPMVLKDFVNDETVTYKNAFIQSEPDEAKMDVAGVASWVFEFEKREALPSLNNANVVGN